ncbi:hypothetical protein FB451DRAFT_1190916 [Mycena latifolia]|nr:hypothetical protein FB451DRAFT_1190916 [Mycena latifolia]
MDATRILNGSYVMLKLCDSQKAPPFPGLIPETEMFQKLSSEPLASDPRNRNSEEVIIVMPLLHSWTNTPFSTIGEAVEFFSQVFELRISFSLSHVSLAIANATAYASHILVDFSHPRISTETRDYTRRPRPARSHTMHPVEYYWMDFDLFGVYDPSAGPPLVDTGYRGTHEVHEWAILDQPCNPFAVNVWCLGFMTGEQFTEVSSTFWLKRGSPISKCPQRFGVLHAKKFEGFEFMHELIADMCQEDPAKRPTMDEVVKRFSEIKVGLSMLKLRSRFVQTYERPSAMEAIRSTMHWARQWTYMMRFKPAIPSPSD